jgi:hypothetical protein
MRRPIAYRRTAACRVWTREKSAEKFMDKVFAAFVQFMKDDKLDFNPNKHCSKFSALFDA